MAGARPRRVLGVDPGTRHTGYAVLEVRHGRIECRKLGNVVLPEGWPLARRLGRLGLEMERLLERYRPDEISIEQAIYAQNVRTALALGQARGVILFCSVASGIDVFEYSPREVKRAVTGTGNASKIQVQGMVKRLLGLRSGPGGDEADAAALALCHLMRPTHPELKPSKTGKPRTGGSRRSSRWTEADITRLRNQGRIR